MLEKKMQELLLNCLSNREKFLETEAQQNLRHVLKSYALLSKQRQAEQLFTDNFVKPFMKMVNVCI